MRLGGATVAGQNCTKILCAQKVLSLRPQDVEAWKTLGHEGGGTVAEKQYTTHDCYAKADALSTAARRRPASMHPSELCQEIDKTIDALETCSSRVKATPASLALSNVAERELLAQADAARDVCDMALLDEPPVLADIFGTDNMQRLVRLRAVGDAVALSEVNKGDPRWSHFRVTLDKVTLKVHEFLTQVQQKGEKGEYFSPGEDQSWLDALAGAWVSERVH